jgi:hypothetical protein
MEHPVEFRLLLSKKKSSLRHFAAVPNTIPVCCGIPCVVSKALPTSSASGQTQIQLFHHFSVIKEEKLYSHALHFSHTGVNTG